MPLPVRSSLDTIRVAVDVTPLLGVRTGIGELVAGLVEGLHRRSDVEVVPVALTWKGRKQAGVSHRPIPARLIQKVWAQTNLFPLTNWAGSVDVVHGTNYVVGPADKSRVPRIVTVHDLAVVKTPALCDPATLVFPRLVQRAVASGAMVQTDSESTAAEVQDWLQISADRVRAVLPGVSPIPAGSSEGLDPRVQAVPFLLTLGTEEPRKGLPRMAAAFARIRELRPDLVWVHAGKTGWGSESFPESIRQITPEHRASVIRLGRVTNDQRAWLLRNAETFVYPSIDEGFGFPPLEALSVGTRVVVADLAVLRETLGDQAVFVKTNDVESLATAAAGFSSGGNNKLQYEIDVLRENRINHAQLFSWDAMAVAQVQWYRDVRSSK